MARTVLLRHPETNEVRKGYYGFCWSGLFLGGLPALARGNLKIGISLLVLAVLPFVLRGVFYRSLAGSFYLFAVVVFASEYNRFYTMALIDQGFQFFDRAEHVAAAKRNLGFISGRVLNIFGRHRAKPAAAVAQKPSEAA